MLVSVDCEWETRPIGETYHAVMITVSYGREDGTSASLVNADGLGGHQVARWLIDELSGPYDVDGVSYKQVPVAFHFQLDSGIIARAWEDGTPVGIIHSATARKHQRVPLCGSRHDHAAEDCRRIDRYSPDAIRAVISDGGESGLLVWHQDSELAIAMTPRRRLYIEHRPAGDRMEERRTVDIHDTGTAFVGGLLAVIKAWQPELTDEQKAFIEWGKNARTANQGFGNGGPDKAARYSEAECIAHARCVRLLLKAIHEAAGIEIRPSKVFGSGSIAAQAFRYHHVPSRNETHAETKKVLRIPLDDIAQLTYFGGMIEDPVIGLVSGDVDEVDLNSAYPAAAVPLPCMRQDHGHWQIEKDWSDSIDPGPGTVGHVRAIWITPNEGTTPPFMVRHKSGNVLQPQTGFATWVTLAEFQSARARFGSKVTADRAVWWKQECKCEAPLAWLAELYEKRQDIKTAMKAVPKDSPEWARLNAHQNAIKLIINSCYGKLAQRRPQMGRFTNLHYAAHITGATRARVREETWLREAQGGRVVYQHTDSVLSRGGAPVDGGKALGAWGMEKPSRDLFIAQPGLAISLGGGKMATRGCRLKEFQDAIEVWIKDVDLTEHPEKWPPIKVKRNAGISRRLALAMNKPWLVGTFLPRSLTIQFVSGKRDFDEARQMEGMPTAWEIPPVIAIHRDDIATIDDIKMYRNELQKLIDAGEHDDE
jgi:hypothetical protein